MGYPLDALIPEATVQNPDDILAAVIATVKRVVEQSEIERIVGELKSVKAAGGFARFPL